LFNISCKKKYGNEYIYKDDILDLKSKINCDKNKKKAKCTIDFDNKNILEDNKNKYSIEHFMNSEDEHPLTITQIIILLFIFFLLLSYFYCIFL
jgi:hypothetical protein